MRARRDKGALIFGAGAAGTGVGLLLINVTAAVGCLQPTFGGGSNGGKFCGSSAVTDVGVGLLGVGFVSLVLGLGISAEGETSWSRAGTSDR
jgi:hypothetical protein